MSSSSPVHRPTGNHSRFDVVRVRLTNQWVSGSRNCGDDNLGGFLAGLGTRYDLGWWFDSGARTTGSADVSIRRTERHKGRGPTPPRSRPAWSTLLLSNWGYSPGHSLVIILRCTCERTRHRSSTSVRTGSPTRLPDGRRLPSRTPYERCSCSDTPLGVTRVIPTPSGVGWSVVDGVG